MARETLLQALKDRQGTTHQTEFAARLGVTQGHWSNVRRGLRPLTDKMIRRARQAFPDLESLCIAALFDEGEDAA